MIRTKITIAAFVSLAVLIVAGVYAGPNPSIVGGGGGGGDVVGPASSTDHAAARFDLATGKLLQDSLFTIDDAGKASTPGGYTYANATYPTAEVFWDGASVGSNNTTVFGHGGFASATGGTAFGWSAYTLGGVSVGSGATSGYGIAIGDSSVSSGSDCTSVGPDSTCVASNGVALGANTDTGGGNLNIVIGQNAKIATAASAYSMAIGPSTSTTSVAGAASWGIIDLTNIFSISDDEDIVINDGTNTYTFRWDSDSSVIQTATLRAINYNPANVYPFSPFLSGYIVASVNGSAILITATDVFTTSLTHDNVGVNNHTITHTMADPSVIITGMTGGVASAPADYAIVLGYTSSVDKADYGIAMGIGASVGVGHHGAMCFGRNCDTIGTYVATFGKSTNPVAMHVTAGLGAWNTTPPSSQPSKISDPTGGTTIDTECRTAINALIDVLEGAGLSAP